MRLPPAEAMRPEAPPIYRPTVVERLGLQRLFPQPVRMVLRQIERKPFRSALSILGVALSIAVMILGSFSKDIVDHIADVQFERSQRYDFHVSFVEPASARALYEIKSLPGVLRAEPFRSIPVRLHAGHHSRRTGIIGLPRNRQLLQLIDLRLHAATLPDEGLVISKTLAESLRVKVGDVITVETMEGERRTLDIRLADLLDDFGGTSAYMDLAALNRFLREGDTISGAFIATDPAHAIQTICRAQEHSAHRWRDFKASGARQFSERPSRRIFCGCDCSTFCLAARSRSASCTIAHALRSPSEAASSPPCVSSVSPVARSRRFFWGR